MRLRPPAVVILCFWAGCGAPSPRDGGAPATWVPELAPDLGVVVARVGGVPIFADEVRAQSEHTGQSVQAALDDLVRQHLLSERAREERLAASDPEEQRALLVQRMIERDFEPHTRPQDIPDDVLRGVYDKLKANYVRPRLVEVALLSVYTGANMKPEPRARARASAGALASYVAQHPPRTADEAAAIAHDPAWSSRKVQFARFWQGEDAQFGGFGPRVARLIQRLHRVGELSPLIDDESGYHFALYLDEKPPLNVPFIDVREQLRTGYYPQWRRERFVQMTGVLLAQHMVEVHADRALAVQTP